MNKEPRFIYPIHSLSEFQHFLLHDVPVYASPCLQADVWAYNGAEEFPQIHHVKRPLGGNIIVSWRNSELAGGYCEHMTYEEGLEYIVEHFSFADTLDIDFECVSNKKLAEIRGRGKFNNTIASYYNYDRTMSYKELADKIVAARERGFTNVVVAYRCDTYSDFEAGLQILRDFKGVSVRGLGMLANYATLLFAHAGSPIVFASLTNHDDSGLLPATVYREFLNSKRIKSGW